MGPNAVDIATDSVQLEPHDGDITPAVAGLMITNGGYDKDKADAVLRDATADLVSFGVPFIPNPDLPERYRRNAALNPPDRDTFYGSGAHGYVDYPALNHNPIE